MKLAVQKMILEPNFVQNPDIPKKRRQRQNIENIKKIAAQLIQCWASIVRPAFVGQLKELEKLYGIAGIGNGTNSGDCQIDPEADTFRTILQSIASLFLLPYPNTPQRRV